MTGVPVPLPDRLYQMLPPSTASLASPGPSDSAALCSFAALVSGVFAVSFVHAVSETNGRTKLSRRIGVGGWGSEFRHRRHADVTCRRDYLALAHESPPWLNAPP